MFPRVHRQPFRRRSRALAATAAAIAIGGTVLTEVPVSAAGKPKGHDVSSHQKNVDWQSAKAKSATFVYVKATESHTYRSPYFSRQYAGSRAAGLIRGACHFALPDRPSGITQARYFVRNGGAWRAEGWTLPPALDIEYNPYGKQKCHGLGKARMAGWITAFSDEVNRLTGRRPVSYTTAHWWNTCTNSSSAFTSRHALWLARYNAADPGALPSGGRKLWTFWQYDNSGSLPGDQNLFNGTSAQLKRFAQGA
ncbi:GH25 family lysozyme [Streptomyces sp. ADMS]|nr:GH25 family lysozyme [Streptomyces sp. ADMS]MDW4908101.1 GH25 family lysozyme [Streptomyces sp. ADMS]